MSLEKLGKVSLRDRGRKKERRRGAIHANEMAVGL